MYFILSHHHPLKNVLLVRHRQAQKTSGLQDLPFRVYAANFISSLPRSSLHFELYVKRLLWCRCVWVCM